MGGQAAAVFGFMWQAPFPKGTLESSLSEVRGTLGYKYHTTNYPILVKFEFIFTVEKIFFEFKYKKREDRAVCNTARSCCEDACLSGYAISLDVSHGPL